METSKRSQMWVSDVRFIDNLLYFGGMYDYSTPTDKAGQIRRVSFNEEVKLSDKNGSKFYEQLDNGSDTSCDVGNPSTSRSTYTSVSGATANLQTAPKEEVTAHVKVAATLSKYEKAAEITLVNSTHAHTHRSNKNE